MSVRNADGSQTVTPIRCSSLISTLVFKCASFICAVVLLAVPRGIAVGCENTSFESLGCARAVLGGVREAATINSIPTLGRYDMARLIPEDKLAILTIAQEALAEPFEGKLAVAEVIRNRMKQRYMSDGTVEGTVLRAWQFSGWE